MLCLEVQKKEKLVQSIELVLRPALHYHGRSIGVQIRTENIEREPAIDLEQLPEPRLWQVCIDAEGKNCGRSRSGTVRKSLKTRG